MNEEKIKEVLSDEAFVKELLQLETAEQVQAALEEKGVELTLEEIKAIGKAVVKMVEADGELSEEDLEEVTGGMGVIMGIAALAISAGIAISTFNVAKNAFKLIKAWC